MKVLRNHDNELNEKKQDKFKIIIYKSMQFDIMIL